MRPDSSGLTIFTCLYFLIKTVKLLEKLTLKASFFSRKQLEGESLAEVQFVIDSRGLVSQSNYLTASRVSPYISFVFYRFLRALQQNRAQSRLLYLLNKTLSVWTGIRITRRVSLF